MKKVKRFLGKQFQAVKARLEKRVLRKVFPDKDVDNNEVNLKSDGVLFAFIAEKITSRGIILVGIIYGLDTLFVLGLFS